MLRGRTRSILQVRGVATRFVQAVQRSVGSISTPSGGGSSKLVNPVNVQHIRLEKKFVLFIDGSSGNSDPAIIEYETIEPDILDLFHTEVPQEHRDKGVAKLLATGAFEHIKQEKLRMKLSCWYLKGYLERNPNPDYAALVVKN